MSRIVVTEYVSLDGVVQGPGQVAEDTAGGFTAGGWTAAFMADHQRLHRALLPTAGGFLLGRRTYEIFATYWPTVTDPHDQIASALNTKHKYVVSTTLTDAPWGPTSVIADDVAGAVNALRCQPGDPILVIGSSQVVHFLFDHHLVDEYQLCVHPSVLGDGKQLFRRGAATQPMRLIESRTTSTGLVLLTYTPSAS